MADYIGMCRSTWFKIKDYDKFMQGLKNVLLDEVTIEQSEKDNNTIIIYGYSSIPNLKSTIEEDDYEEFDFIEYIKQHIVEGEKVRITEIGYEKLRYLTAFAYDISTKEIKTVDASAY